MQQYTPLSYLLLVLLLLNCNNSPKNITLNDLDVFDSKNLTVSKQMLEQNFNPELAMYDTSYSLTDLKRIRERLAADIDTFCVEGTQDTTRFATIINQTFAAIKDYIPNEPMLNDITNLYRLIALEGGKFQPMMWANYKARSSFFDQISANRMALILERKVRDATADREDATQHDEIVNKFVQEVLLSDVLKLRKDAVMKEEEFQDMVKGSLAKLEGKELSFNNGMDRTLVHLVPDVYYKMSLFLHVDANKLLVDWFETNNAYTPPSYDELQEEAKSYLGLMLSERLISRSDYEKLDMIVSNDLQMFREKSDTTVLKARVEQSLKEIEQIALDTEDQEYITCLYYNLAVNRKIDISRSLNTWLYNEEITTLDDEFAQGKMPWES